ncbi:MAG: hypothetical protein WAX89_07020 [Alphaproteobacteria bacterium]
MFEFSMKLAELREERRINALTPDQRAQELAELRKLMRFLAITFTIASLVLLAVVKLA